MKKTPFKFIYKVALVGCLLTTFSCKKMFDIAPQDQVDATNHYRNIYDANAAVIGIYGQLLGIADRYVVLNELRADLMKPTANADQWLRQLNEHNVTTDNPWADPRPFYKIILNCNDAMKNFDIMVAGGKMNQTDYQQRYSDVGAVRSWLYLQLGMHFGSVPYVTDALSSVDDLKDASKFPKLTFDQLLDKLIAFMGDSKRFMDIYPTTVTTTGASNTSLNTSVDGYSTNLMFINKSILLGDLYLWKGNYTLASKWYRYAIELPTRTSDPSTNSIYYSTYKVASEANAQLFISYSTASDDRTLVDQNNSGWRSMFALQQVTAVNQEWMWSIPFDKNFLPVDPFIDLFSNQGGRYQLTASQLAMDNWNKQVQSNGFPFDARGRMSVKTINGQPVIMKQLYYYLDGTSLIPSNILQKQGRWLIYRGGTNLLHFAEATCNDASIGADATKLAYALTNVGVSRVYDSRWPGSTTGLSADHTNIMQTNLPAPYDIDARNGETPYFRGVWYRQSGVHARAGLVDLPSSYASDKISMENAIIDEDGLESAFEGNRWADLLRVAIRRNDPSFLAEKVYQKLLRDGNPNASAVRTKLLNKDWFLPFKL